MLGILTPCVAGVMGAMLSSGTTDNTSMANILKMAGELMTWVITQMSAVLAFITSNTLILTVFVMSICGFAVGFLFRIWHSA